MNPSYSKSFSLPIEEQIKLEISNYKEALKSDEEFYVVTAIKQQIKMLEDQLRQRQGNFVTMNR